MFLSRSSSCEPPLAYQNGSSRSCKLVSAEGEQIHPDRGVPQPDQNQTCPGKTPDRVPMRCCLPRFCCGTHVSSPMKTKDDATLVKTSWQSAALIAQKVCSRQYSLWKPGSCQNMSATCTLFGSHEERPSDGSGVQQECLSTGGYRYDW